MKVRNDPSPNDWMHLERRIREGAEPASAARERGHTLSDYRRHDPMEQRRLLDIWRDETAHADQEIAKKTLREIAEDGETESARVSAAVALDRRSGAYTEKIEVSGPDGAPLEIEDRSSSLDDVLVILGQIGAIPANGGGTLELEMARSADVLPDPSERERAADGVPGS